MTRLFKTTIHFAAAICASTAGPGRPEPPRVETRQGASGTELTLNEINTENYPDVAIFATILKDGEPVTGLGAGDFKVSEDEVEQSPLTVEAQLPPLSVVVTVDVSGSMSSAWTRREPPPPISLADSARTTPCSWSASSERLPR